MRLIVDVGNSEIKMAIFDNGLLYKTHFKTKEATSDVLFNKISEFTKGKEGINEAFIASVLPSLNSMIADSIALVLGIKAKVLDSSFNKKVLMDIDNPLEVGADLVADIVGATNKYGYPLLICDLGTVSKYLSIDDRGYFVGASFTPGLQISMNAFHSNTELLPSDDINEAPMKVYGKNTNECMSSGVYYGTIFAIEGYLNEMRKLYPNAKCVITGGFSNIIKDKKDYIIDPNLTLDGLDIIYRKLGD